MADFQLMNPYWLIGLIPALALSLWIKNSISSQGLIAPHLSMALGVNQHGKRYIHLFWLVFWCICFIALSGPSFEKQTRPAFNVSYARVLVLDMSRSLYANDIKPNRLDQLKYKALDLLPEWAEGSTGLVAFAGGAYTISPLTTDSQTLANLTPDLKPEIMPHQGSNAISAVELAIQLMLDSGHQKGDIILLADELTSLQAEKINELLGNEWRMSVIAVGTEQGAPILLPSGELLKSPNGNTVIAKTQFEGFREVARHSGGVFSPLRGDGRDVEAIAKLSITPSTSDDTNSQEVKDRINNGYWVLPLLVFASLALFRKGFIFAALLFVLPMPKQALASSAFQTDDQAAFQAFQNQEYEKSAELFKSKEWAGSAWYEAKQYDKAIENLEGIETEGAQYNLANALAQIGESEKARELYHSLLEKNPNFDDATHNLRVVEEALKQQQQQQQQQQQDSQDRSNQEKTESQQDSSPQNDESESSNSQNQQNQKEENGENSTSQNSDASPQSSNESNKTGEPDKNQQPNGSRDDNDIGDNKVSGSESENNSDKKTSEEETAKQIESSHSSAPESNDDLADAQSLLATENQEKDSTQEVDPKIRQLEQIQQQADSSRLLRAQMILQEKQNPVSQRSEQSW